MKLNFVRFFLLFTFCAFILFSIGIGVQADEYTSTNFIIRDPVITSGGSFSSSTDFQLFGAISQLAVGTSTITSFGINTGFFYYPYVSSPIVSATAGDSQAALTWTASQGYLGWNVSGYNVGQSTTSGGPYAYTTSLGNVKSSTRTGLTNGTAYYFVIRIEDAFGNSVATSTEVSATPVASGAVVCGDGSCFSGSENCSTCPADCGVCPVSAGGGGGGYTPPVVTQVNFKGRAYPGSKVTLLKDAQLAASVPAGSDANFEISLSGLSAGNFIFGVYSEDNKGNRSSLSTFSISVTRGAATQVSGIFIAPTIAVDKSEVKKGENIAIFGQSASQADVIISVNSEEEFFDKIKADENGAYLYNFDTSLLDMGQHFTKSKSVLAGAISSFGKAVGFIVGTKTVIAEPQAAPAKIKGDMNGDARVNLLDFSITAYWYKRPAPPPSVDLNGDGKIDLVDFSIMAYYWTG